jgi:hypothetical protein
MNRRKFSIVNLSILRLLALVEIKIWYRAM